MNAKKCVLVLGMHRSGTSALTGVLNLLGVDLGVHMMPPAEENCKGYFENYGIYETHERILATVGSAWDDPLPLPVDWWKQEGVRPLKERIIEILHTEFTGDIIAVKDPRLSRLLPLWDEILAELGMEGYCLLPLRHPWEVAESLKRRNGFSMEKSNLLWASYLFEAELNSRGRPRAFLTFDDLLADPQAAVTRAFARMGLELELPQAFTDSTDSIDGLIRPELKHHNLRSKEAQEAILEEALQGYRLLTEFAADDVSEADRSAAIDDLRKRYFRYMQIFYNADVARKFKEWAEWKETRGQKEADAVVSAPEAPAVESAAPKSEMGGVSPLETRNITHSVRRVLKRILRGIFRRLPLSSEAKWTLKTVFFRMFWRWVRETNTYREYLQAVVTRLGPVPSGFEADAETILRNVKTGSLAFDAAPRPKVSIVIPVRNKMEYTYNCLKSLMDHASPTAPTMEIIVVDDGSRDRTPKMLSRIPGISVFRHKSNRGFTESCNDGANLARGEYLVFLNNDTMVQADWLEWLVRTFEWVPDAGLVGAKLVFPDGRLQEGGGIVWRDGSCSHYGRLDDPGRPEWNYLREVDYSSGACIILPKQLFEAVGMFDPEYSPAYYEDVDLAFKVRAFGKKVLYQPMASVVHFEGATAGTDPSVGIKKYQILNQKKFLARWKDRLATLPEKHERLDLERDRYASKRILIVDQCICLPDQDAGSQRMYHLIQILQELGYKVAFFSESPYLLQPYLSNLQGRGAEVLTESAFGSFEQYLDREGDRFDVAMVSRLKVAEHYMDSVIRYCSKAMIVYDTVDLHHLRAKREAELKRDEALIRAAEAIKNSELGIAAKADLTIVVSPEEKRLLKAENPDLRVEIIPTIQRIFGCRAPFAGRSGLLFIGGFRHAPNIDAVLFFLGEVLPFIRERIPGLKAYIIGVDPPPEIRALASDLVVIEGYVPDVEPYFNRCRLSVAPLRFGAGVKGKINLSMSYGLPVVGTPLAAEGMYLRDGEDLLLASRPEDFAEAVVKLHEDESLWYRLSANGLENVRTHFSYDAVKEVVRAVFDGQESMGES